MVVNGRFILECLSEDMLIEYEVLLHDLDMVIASLSNISLKRLHIISNKIISWQYIEM